MTMSHNKHSAHFRALKTIRNYLDHEITFILLKNYGSLPLNGNQIILTSFNKKN